MLLSRLLICDGGCATTDIARMNASLVLSFVGVAVAAAAVLGSIVRRRLGLTILWFHALLYAINLALFWGLADSPWVFLPLAAVAAAAGHVAVGAHHIDRNDERS